MRKMCNTDVEGRMYVLLMFTFFPLFVLNGYSNITLTKCVTFIAITAFFAIALLVNYITAFTEGKRPEISIKRGLSSLYFPDWFLLLMLVFTAISCLLSPYAGLKNSSGLSVLLFGAGRFDGILFIIVYMLIFWLTARHGKFGKWYAIVFALTTGIMCIITIIQLGGTNLFNLYPKGAYKGHYNHFVATIGNVDMMAGYLSMAWPLMWAAYVLFSFESGENPPKFIEKQGAKDIIKAYSVFEKNIRYIFLMVLCLSIYVGLKIEVELFKVTLVAVLLVMIPLFTRSVENICRILESLSAIILVIGISSTVTYTYIERDKKTLTELDATSMFFVCLVVALVLFISAIVIRKIKNTPKRKTKKSKKEAKQSKIKKPFLVVSLCIVLAEVLCVIGAFIYLRFIYVPTAQSGVMYDLYELTRGHLNETAGSHRGAIWKYSLKMAKENLIFGTGTGTFAKSFKEFTKEVGYNYYQNKNLDFAHNEYINILCTSGLAGLLTYLGFLLSTAYLSVKTMAKNPRVLVLFAAVLGYVFQAFFSFSIVIITPIFWVLIGLLVKEARDTLIIKK
ncbi:MAG: O-antigen ligase family protein [Clostridia bacterium]|nr:O-antigen ligase family protein [Clostridia bacterium]